MLTTFQLFHLVGISQHLYLIISANLRNLIYLKVPKERKKTRFGRNWRVFNKNEFKEELEKSSWDNVTSPHIDTNTSVSNFYFKIETLLDEMAPFKKLTEKEIGLQQRPWITPDIIAAIKERNKLYKEFLE